MKIATLELTVTFLITGHIKVSVQHLNRMEKFVKKTGSVNWIISAIMQPMKIKNKT